MLIEYALAGVMGIFLGILSAILGYLKQKDPVNFSYKPLILRIPCGVCAAILLKYYCVEGLEALAVGMAITEFQDTGVKLVLRRFFGNRVDLIPTEEEKEETK